MPAGASNLDQAYAEQKKKTTLAAVAISLLALLAFGAAVATGAFRTLGLKDSQPVSKVLQAEGSLPGAALAMQGQRPAPVLTTQGNLPAVMPDDVRAWLEHLHQTELSRIAMTNGQLTDAAKAKTKSQLAGGYEGVESALNGIDDPNSQLVSPVDTLAKLVKKMHDDCVKLIDQFDSVQAPAECVPIKNAYDRTLTETAGELGDIGDHLAAGDIDKLQSMKGTSVGQIDTYGKKTDRMVGEICAKYNTAKWFEINSDISPGGIFGIGF